MRNLSLSRKSVSIPRLDVELIIMGFHVGNCFFSLCELKHPRTITHTLTPQSHPSRVRESKRRRPSKKMCRTLEYLQSNRRIGQAENGHRYLSHNESRPFQLTRKHIRTMVWMCFLKWFETGEGSLSVEQLLKQKFPAEVEPLGSLIGCGLCPLAVKLSNIAQMHQ